MICCLGETQVYLAILCLQLLALTGTRGTDPLCPHLFVAQSWCRAELGQEIAALDFVSHLQYGRSLAILEPWLELFPLSRSEEKTKPN